MSGLRRLVLVKSVAEPAHMALLPVLEGGTVAARKKATLFVCPCGQVFEATTEVLSWTTEYEPRCLYGILQEK